MKNGWNGRGGDQITFLTSQRLEDNLIVLAHLFLPNERDIFLPNERESRIIEESVPKGQWKNWGTFLDKCINSCVLIPFVLSWYITSFQCA
jgi:hypothetical protein